MSQENVEIVRRNYEGVSAHLAPPQATLLRERLQASTACFLPLRIRRDRTALARPSWEKLGKVGVRFVASSGDV